VDFRALSIPDLISRCVKQNEARAWEEFVRRFHRTIAGAAYTAAASFVPPDKELVEDLVQEAFLRLCAHQCRALREFRASEENRFYGFLRAITWNTVRDHFRHIHAVKRQAESEALPLDSQQVQQVISSDDEKAFLTLLTLDEIDRVLRISDTANPDRNRLVFWLYYRDGFSCAEIARLVPIGLSAKGVETLLRRLKSNLQRHAAAGIGGAE
jgi:RNA polymerase sigma-70 factor, ECF subfamily